MAYVTTLPVAVDLEYGERSGTRVPRVSERSGPPFPWSPATVDGRGRKMGAW